MKYIGFMLLAACGRFDFDPVGDGGGNSPDTGPSTITVRVTTVYNDGVPITPAGVPVAGAIVLAGFERTPTDATGTAVVGATEPVDISVEWENPDHFEYVVTALAVPPGSELVIGDRPRSANPPVIHLALPTLPTATSYAIALPIGCAAFAQSSPTPTFDISFYDHCAGATVPAFAVAGTSYLDLGMITLAAGATISPTGSWNDETSVDVKVSGLPVGIDHVAALGIASPNGNAGVGPFVSGDPATDTNTFTLRGPPANVVGIECQLADQSEGYAGTLPFAQVVAFSPPPLLATTQARDSFTVTTTDFGAATAMRLLSAYNGSVFLEWTIVGEPRAGTIQFPDVPVKPDVDPSLFSAVLATVPDLSYRGELAGGLAQDLNVQYPPALLESGRSLSIAQTLQGTL